MARRGRELYVLVDSSKLGLPLLSEGSIKVGHPPAAGHNLGQCVYVGTRQPWHAAAGALEAVGPPPLWRIGQRRDAPSDDLPKAEAALRRRLKLMADARIKAARTERSAAAPFV